MVALVGVGFYAVVAFRGPGGFSSLMEKQQEVHRLQIQNADLQRENDRKRERKRQLEDSEGEQELEIRKRLKYLRPGEKSFILPEARPVEKK